MLKQASVSDLITDRVSRDQGFYVVIAMRRYPRFINRALRDEYQPALASDTILFEDWLSTKRRTNDHNGAFEKVRFEERFELDDEGMEHLRRLSQLSRKVDVYLVCQCAQGLRCHREMLLLLAKERFGAKIEAPKNDYPNFLKKLSNQERAQPMAMKTEPAEGDRKKIDEALAKQQKSSKTKRNKPKAIQTKTVASRRKSTGGRKHEANR